MTNALANVELELVEERAYALGRAGNRLEEAIERWEAVDADPRATPEQREAALRDVAAAGYALLVQRDCAGFHCDNLRWIKEHYAIPKAALHRI